MLVFKTSQRRLQDMSWRRLQHVFSVKNFYLPRPLEDVLQIRLKDLLKTSCRNLTRRLEDVFKTSWGRLGRLLKKLLRWRRLQDVLKTCLEAVSKTSWKHILKTSSRRLGNKQNVYWKYLYLTNLNVYLTNQYFTNLYLTKGKSKMHSLEPNNFEIETHAVFLS